MEIFWTIDGSDVGLLGIQPTKQYQDPVLESNLTLIGSAQYDNASIQCLLGVSPTTNRPLPPAFLTVLGKPQS